MRFDFDIRNMADEIVFQCKHLLHVFGRRVDLHVFENPDTRGCFHTHPARALRVVLWGGYTEEIFEPGDDGHPILYRVRRAPGHIGYVYPEFTHRIHALDRGRSVSLWFRGRITHPVKFIGPGWGEQEGNSVEAKE